MGRKLPLTVGFRIAAVIAALICAHAPACAAWQTYQVSLAGANVSVIHPAPLVDQRPRLEWLVNMADRSTVTTNSLETNVPGLALPGDVFVVTSALLLWFNCNTPDSVSTNGGGGMLRGIWILHRDGSNSLNFKRITNAKNYSPSLMYAGSAPGVQGSGISLLGNFGEQNIDNGVTFAIEHEHQPSATAVTGTTIIAGPHTGGVFVQFTGQLANSSLSPSQLAQLGLDDHYDCDARPGITGRCQYTLTYRIPANGEQFRQEISLSVTQNNFGPGATMVLSHNLAGYPGTEAIFVSQPQLNRAGLTPVSTPYFQIPGHALSFYALPWQSRPGVNRWWETPIGQGQLAGMGAPAMPSPVPFFTYIPDLQALPPDIRLAYALQSIDNQGANAAHRCLALDLQLWDVNRAGTAPKTCPTGSLLQITTDYRIDYPATSEVGTDLWNKI